MPSRPSWEGFLKVNLISVPVKAYNAAESGDGKVSFHLVHKECNSRIRYKKVCTIHGEVENAEIVKAYEYGKGKYVIVEPEEFDELRSESDKAINVEAFIPPEALDPIYYDGRNYYLVPDGKVAQKPYSVLHDVMAEQGRLGVAQVVFSGREQVAVVRPLEKLLVMSLLSYADQIRKPDPYEGDVHHAAVSAEERRLAESLIEASTAESFDIGKYKDDYNDKLHTLIQAKVKGKKIVAPPKAEEPAVINLMDALRQSLNRVQKGNERAHKRRPTARAARRRKSA